MNKYIVYESIRVVSTVVTILIIASIFTFSCIRVLDNPNETSNISIEARPASVYERNSTNNIINNTSLSLEGQQRRQQQQISIGLKCISFEKEMETLLTSTRQVYILMEAKSAGSSIAVFVQRLCMKDYNLTPGTRNFLHPKSVLEYIESHNDVFPPVLSSHAMVTNNLIDRIKEATDDTFIIYMHRPETERLISAIKFVTQQLCANDIRVYDPVMDRISYDPKTGICIVEESAVFDIVKDKVNEIDIGLKRGIGCSVYNEIQKHRPNMVIAHFTQADKIQKAIAKHYCSDVLDKLPLHMNVGKDDLIHVRLGNNGNSEVVTIADWVKKKKHAIRLIMDLFDDYECQGKMRNIEDKMFSSTSTCDDELVQLIAGSDLSSWLCSSA